MPISKSAKKALRVSLKKTSQNRHRKDLIKKALKNVDEKSVNEAFSMIDKGVKWGIFHLNKAARLKSNLSKEFATKPVKSEKTEAKSKAKPKAASKTKKAPAKKTKKA